MTTFNELPPNLPAPEDDGGAAHLVGLRLPALSLPSTQGGVIDLGQTPGTWVIFCYPLTGRPGVPMPEGWDQIPGARGCTPQSCAFRDRHAALTSLGATVVGLSVQATDYQQEMAERLHLPFAVLSDSAYRFQQALRLPTFVASGMTLLRRLTLVARDGVIVAVHYPVFPSDQDADWVLDCLRQHPASD